MKNYFLPGSFPKKDSGRIQICRVMKLTTCSLLLCSCFAFAGQANSQNAKVSLNKNQVQLEEVLNEIEKQTDYLFISNRDVNLKQHVSIHANKRSVRDILSEVLKNTGLTFTVEGVNIVLSVVNPISTIVAPQHERKIEGKIVDAKGEPIIGANIIEKGTTNGVISDLDGNFYLNVAPDATLVISYIGYASQELKTQNKTSFHIILREDSETLNEVVVTALGIKREEKALGYAVQKVGGDKMNTVKSVDVGTALTGKIAGLNVQNSTEFNEAPSILLRGESPLLVVDGVPYNNLSLRDIASDDIESVDVLKGATASALYGSRGGAGAIMVTTKKGKEEGLNIDINSSTMFESGFLKLPEVQTSYSAGAYGKYNANELLWGDELDIGRMAVQYDPNTYEWREMPLVSKGKNNFKNFLEFSFVTNNNVSVTQKGKYGSFRTSLTHVYNKGQYPNTKLNKMTYTVGGNMKFISEICKISEKQKRQVEALAEDGKTPLFFVKEDRLLGVIAVADVIKEESARAVKELQNMGIRVVMLTGDNERTARAIGRQAGVDEVIAGVLPEGKESVIRSLKEKGKVAMVGDGINDAPALTRADMGIAIGAGTDIAIDAADVVLMKSKLDDVPAAIRLSRATLRNIHENLFWAFIYNIIGIPLAAGIWIPVFGWQLNPMFGAAAMSLSSFCVVTNALRLNLFQIHNAAKDKEIKNPVTLHISHDENIKEEKENKTMVKVTVNVEGMMCGHCEAHVNKAIQAAFGAEDVVSSHENGTTVFTVPEKVDEAKVEEVIKEAGYEFKGITQE